MSRPDEPPLDLSGPQAARRYDAMLGGKDNFGVDRAAVEDLRQELPSISEAARELRRFLQRVTHYLAADRGIRQILDIGCGLPHTPNVHEIAQDIDPTSHIVYVDPDPIVGVHARALLTSDPAGRVEFIAAGLDDIDAVLLDAGSTTLDFDEPVAVLLLAVLHFIPDDQRIHQALDRIKAVLAPGSCIALSLVTFDPLSADHAARLAKLAEPDAGQGPFRARTRAEVTALLHGLDLVEPGVVSVVNWHAEREPHPQISAEQAVAYGAVAVWPNR